MPNEVIKVAGVDVTEYRVISDLDEVIERIEEDPKGQTGYALSDDGRVKIRKGSPSAYLAGAAVPKAAYTPEQLRAMAESKGLPWNDAYAGREAEWFASDERVDRHGDIVMQSWTFENYKSNPLMLWSHEWNQPPVGSVIDWSIVQRQLASAAGLITAMSTLKLIGIFATAEQYAWADTIFRLTSARFLRSGSVGFYPGEILQVTDEAQRVALGLGRWGVIYRNNEMIEWTVASVPANVGAHLSSLKKAASEKKIVPADLLVLLELKRVEIASRPGPGDSKKWDEAVTTLKSSWKNLFPDYKAEDKPLDLHEPVAKCGGGKGKPGNRKEGTPVDDSTVGTGAGEVDGDDEAGDTIPEQVIVPGDFCEYASAAGPGPETGKGRIVSIHAVGNLSEVVPDITLQAGEDDPACIVAVLVDAGSGKWKPSGQQVGALMSSLKKVEPLAMEEVENAASAEILAAFKKMLAETKAEILDSVQELSIAVGALKQLTEDDMEAEELNQRRGDDEQSSEVGDAFKTILAATEQPK